MIGISISNLNVGLLHTWKVVRRKLSSLLLRQMRRCMSAVWIWVATILSTKWYVSIFSQTHTIPTFKFVRSPTLHAQPTASPPLPRSSTTNTVSSKVWWRPYMPRPPLKRRSMGPRIRTGVVAVVSTIISSPRRLVRPRRWAKSFLLSMANWRKSFCVILSQWMMSWFFSV